MGGLGEWGDNLRGQLGKEWVSWGFQGENHEEGVGTGQGELNQLVQDWPVLSQAEIVVSPAVPYFPRAGSLRHAQICEH